MTKQLFNTLDAETAISISSSSNNGAPLNVGDFDKGRGIDEGRLMLLRTTGNENRQDWLHRTTHIMGMTIICSFLIFSFISIFLKDSLGMPDYLIAIVSTVIGFYFGNSFKDKN